MAPFRNTRCHSCNGNRYATYVNANFIIPLPKKNMLSRQEYRYDVSQPYAFNSPEIKKSIEFFLGINPTTISDKKMEKSQKTVTQILCSLATPRHGGCPSPLEYLIIQSIQGIPQKNNHIHQQSLKGGSPMINDTMHLSWGPWGPGNAKREVRPAGEEVSPSQKYIDDAENKKMEFLKISSQIQSKFPDKIDSVKKAEEIAGKFIKSSMWWFSVIELYKLLDNSDKIALREKIFEINSDTDKIEEGIHSTGLNIEDTTPDMVLKGINVSFDKKITYITQNINIGDKVELIGIKRYKDVLGTVVDGRKLSPPRKTGEGKFIIEILDKDGSMKYYDLKQSQLKKIETPVQKTEIETPVKKPEIITSINVEDKRDEKDIFKIVALQSDELNHNFAIIHHRAATT